MRGLGVGLRHTPRLAGQAGGLRLRTAMISSAAQDASMTPVAMVINAKPTRTGHPSIIQREVLDSMAVRTLPRPLNALESLCSVLLAMQKAGILTSIIDQTLSNDENTAVAFHVKGRSFGRRASSK